MSPFHQKASASEKTQILLRPNTDPRNPKLPKWAIIRWSRLKPNFRIDDRSRKQIVSDAYEFQPLPGDLLLHVLLSQCVFWRRESAELIF